MNKADLFAQRATIALAYYIDNRSKELNIPFDRDSFLKNSPSYDVLEYIFIRSFQDIERCMFEAVENERERMVVSMTTREFLLIFSKQRPDLVHILDTFFLENCAN